MAEKLKEELAYLIKINKDGYQFIGKHISDFTKNHSPEDYIAHDADLDRKDIASFNFPGNWKKFRTLIETKYPKFNMTRPTSVYFLFEYGVKQDPITGEYESAKQIYDPDAYINSPLYKTSKQFVYQDELGEDYYFLADDLIALGANPKFNLKNIHNKTGNRLDLSELTYLFAATLACYELPIFPKKSHLYLLDLNMYSKKNYQIIEIPETVIKFTLKFLSNKLVLKLPPRVRHLEINKQVSYYSNKSEDEWAIIELSNELPDTLKFLSIQYLIFENKLKFPDNIRYLAIRYTTLFEINLPESLDQLVLKKVNLTKNTKLASIPSCCLSIDIENSNISHLPKLPDGLKKLIISYTNVTKLPDLPASLVMLDISGSHITELPDLPESLIMLNISGNQITELPDLPESLIMLDISGSNITKMPKKLPSNIRGLKLNKQLEDQYYYYRDKYQAKQRITELKTIILRHDERYRIYDIPELFNKVNSYKK